jgi:hypothetical protein
MTARETTAAAELERAAEAVKANAASPDAMKVADAARRAAAAAERGDRTRALEELDELRKAARALEADEREQVGAIPAGREEPRTREDLLAELGYRVERSSRLDGSERDAQVAAMRALLERAIATQPDDEGLAALLAELLVTELHDAGAARAVLARFARPGPGGSRVAMLVRQAAALEGEASLARELRSQDIVPRPAAQKVARSILERVRAGAGYVEAERTVLAATSSAPSSARP